MMFSQPASQLLAGCAWMYVIRDGRQLMASITPQETHLWLGIVVVIPASAIAGTVFV
nr:IncF plasmid conjugative transfer pilus assembly protein TraK [Escherichia coli]